MPTLRVEVAASQTGATLVDPGANAGLVLEWITVSPASDIEAEVFYGATQSDTNTIIHIQKGGIDKPFGGLRLPKAAILKLTNGTDTVKVVIEYALHAHAP